MLGITATKCKLRAMFREYFNDYLTIQAYADAYGMLREDMYRRINLGRILHNKYADKLKGIK